MSYVAFYNHTGQAIAWLADDVGYPTIYLFNGKPVAWLADEHLYAFSGKYLGWFQDGWIRDRYGYAVFFAYGATGGPIKPVRQARPARSARRARPARGARRTRPARPTRKLNWSEFSDEGFFY